MKRRESPVFGELLHGIGLLVALALIVVAEDFLQAQPALGAGLIALLSLPYLGAALARRRPHFLLGYLLFAAVAYFLLCYAGGAPGQTFPLLSVPLVLMLLVVGNYLYRRLPAELHSYPHVLLVAADITMAVFSVWAAVELPSTLAAGPWLALVAPVTYGLFGAFCLWRCYRFGPSYVWAYSTAVYIAAGAFIFTLAVDSGHLGWIPLLATGTALLFVGVDQSRARGWSWSGHFGVAGIAILATATVCSLWRWPHVLWCLTLTSAALWSVYFRLSQVVGDVRRATMVERGAGKALFLSALALLTPLVPAVVAWPLQVSIGGPALLAAWILFRMHQRRCGELLWNRPPYLRGVVFFATAGILALLSELPSVVAFAGWILTPALVVAFLGHRCRRDADQEATCLSYAEAALWPVLLGWYIPLRAGVPGVALASALLGFAAVAVVAIMTTRPSFSFAAGAAAAGGLVSLLFIASASPDWLWFFCLASSALAALVAAANAGRDRPIVRGTAHVVWIVLNAAAITFAISTGIPESFLALCGTAIVSSLLTGHEDRRDAWTVLAVIISTFATVVSFVSAPFCGLLPASAGTFLVLLGVAHWTAWRRTVTRWHVWCSDWLIAAGGFGIVLGLSERPELRLAAGAILVLVVFTIAAARLAKRPRLAGETAAAGHVAGVGFAILALVAAWSGPLPRLALSAAAMTAIYALYPRLRGRPLFRIGALCWAALALTLGLAGVGGWAYYAGTSVIALLSAVWLVAGVLLNRHGAPEWARSCHMAAAVVAVFCGVVSLLAPAGPSHAVPFVVIGMVFACLFVALGDYIFAYLLTASVVFMAFDWIKASTSHFTRDVMFYLVITTLIAGGLYLLPVLRRWFARVALVPLFQIFTWRGALLMMIPVSGFAAMALSAYSIKITEHPKFCISCHHMDNYYTSWQHSSHKDVACIQCHYDPGLAAELEGKMEGMVQLFKYISHSYGMKPHAIISNRSCMRSGCHADMDQSKEVLLFRGRIRFRHDRHLSEHPRGQTLNCVSCHGQSVEGQHITVAKTTCITCHFYGSGDHPVAAGDCQTCHSLPDKPVSQGDQSFNHKAFLKDAGKVACDDCHSNITVGTGRVSHTRCQNCHLERKHEMEDVTDLPAFHLIHVYSGHFDCLQCHDEIVHGEQTMQRQSIITERCDRCHGDERHTIQAAVYSGRALPDLKHAPDVMFKAGVACNGCHVHMDVEHVGTASVTTRRAGPAPCSTCHGDEMYSELLTAWQDEIRDRLGDLEGVAKELTEAAPADSPAAKALNEAKGCLALVRRDGSYGAHNYEYIGKILDQAEAGLDSCRALVKPAGSQ